jgi:transcriptional regulator with XRE-family HTH domain
MLNCVAFQLIYRVTADMQPNKPKTTAPSKTTRPSEPDPQAEFRQRLSAVLAMTGVTPKRGIPRLHERLAGSDVSLSTARKLVAGEGYPRAETLAALLRDLGISIDWLLGGYGQPLLATKAGKADNQWDAVVFLKLPKEPGGKPEIVLAPGLRDHRALRVDKVIGDAMAPDLLDGDYALVNTQVSAIQSDKIYLLRANAGLFFRRIDQSLVGAGMRLVPRNDKMAPEHVAGVALPGERKTHSPVELLGVVEMKLLAQV